MAAYIIANFRITDLEKIREFRELAIPIIRDAGGKPIVVTDDAEVLEGSPQPTVIVHKFDSREAAHKLFNSSEFQAIQPIRLSATENSWVVIADEYVASSG